MWGTRTVGKIEYFDERTYSLICRKVNHSFSWDSTISIYDIDRIKTKINGNDSARGTRNFGDAYICQSDWSPKLTNGYDKKLVYAQGVNADKHLLDSFIEFIFVCL
jgi:hypothetical protein